MYDIWAFQGIESLVSSGLGGGSLIYANVLLRKDPAWFVDDTPGGPPRPWPISYDDLVPHYEAAEAMLGATRYPFDVAPYSTTAKTAATRRAAEALGLDWQLPPLAVSFADHRGRFAPGIPLEEPAANLHGAPRRTCRLCGECDMGCNDGAKNTLDLTYLSRAVDAGATIRTLSEVKRLDPIGPGAGYRVGYVRHDPDEPTRPPQPADAEAPCVVLGAGTFGSTYLLLRNRAAFPGLGPALGTRFSGNGDLLTFLRHDGAADRPATVLDPERGPVITSAIRLPDTLDGDGDVGRGFYVEDGGNPEFLDWLVQSTDGLGMTARAAAFAARRIWSHLRGHPRANLSGDIAGLLGGGRASSTFLPVLSMGRDTPDGVLQLRDGDLALTWTTATSADYFSRVEATLGDIARVLGARVTNTPLWLFKKVITVHPLGGLPMGHSPDDGVVDQWGEVWAAPGLHVVDGSVLPGPVGPNPSLTIAAIGERAAAHILGEDPR